MEQEIAQSSLDIFKGKFEIKNFLSFFCQHYTWRYYLHMCKGSKFISLSHISFLGYGSVGYKKHVTYTSRPHQLQHSSRSIVGLSLIFTL